MAETPPPADLPPPRADEREGDEGVPPTAIPDPRRLRRKGQDPTIDRGVDAKEMWRIFRIISEFVEAIDGLRNVRPAITIWGSARTKPGHPHYTMAQETA